MGKSSKEKILNNALELFTEHSYREVTIEQIADNSGVSKGAVFHYFDSKYELALECLYSELQEFSSQIYSQLEGAEKPEEKLKLIIDITVDYFVEQPKIARFFIELYEQKIESEESFKSITDFYTQDSKKIGEELFNELGASKPEERTHLLLACMDGLALQFLFMDEFDHFPDIEKLKKEMYALFGEKS